jgi:8-oxo-dGTP pyrophosphatase MutT (NUDIX family)/ubiquinone/menaquinone biosynthesis C-methylase UbiE
MINIISAGVIIYHSKKESILLVKDISSTKWGFPKGHIEKGENLEDTARREVYEEVGIKNITFIKHLGKVTYEYKHESLTHKKTAYYFLALTSTSKLVIDSEEILEAKWVKIDKVCDFIEFDDLLSVYKEAVQNLDSNNASTLISQTGERFVDIDSFKNGTKSHHYARYTYVAERVDKSKNLLDVGCGTGYGTELLSTHVNSAVGIDISSDAINFASQNYHKSNLEYKNCNINELTKKYDVITCFEVLEHIDLHQVPMFIENMINCLKPGGTLYLSTPTDSKIGENIYHKNQISSDRLKTFLGFRFKHVELIRQAWGIKKIDANDFPVHDFNLFVGKNRQLEPVLSNLNSKALEAVEELRELSQEILGESLISILMFGSQVYSEIYTKYSDYDFILILRKNYNDIFDIRKLKGMIKTPGTKFMFKYIDEINEQNDIETTDYVLSPFRLEMMLAQAVYGENPYLKASKQVNIQDLTRDAFVNCQMRIYWIRKGLLTYPTLQFNRRVEFYIKNLMYDLQNILLLDGYLTSTKFEIVIQIHGRYDFLKTEDTKILLAFVDGTLDLSELSENENLTLLNSIYTIHLRVMNFLRDAAMN